MLDMIKPIVMSGGQVRSSSGKRLVCGLPSHGLEHENPESASRGIKWCYFPISWATENLTRLRLATYTNRFFLHYVQRAKTWNIWQINKKSHIYSIHIVIYNTHYIFCMQYIIHIIWYICIIIHITYILHICI